jgi:hypothetical protein
VNQELTNYVLQELLPTFENLEAQSAAIVLFLKDRGMANDEALKPYFEQAGLATNVKWRAVRARLGHLLAPPPKSATEVAKKETPTPKEEQEPEADKETEAAKPVAKAEPKPAKAESAAKPKADEEQKADKEQAKTTEKASDAKQEQGATSEGHRPAGRIPGDRSKDGQRTQQQRHEDTTNKDERTQRGEARRSQVGDALKRAPTKTVQPFTHPGGVNTFSCKSESCGRAQHAVPLR